MSCSRVCLVLLAAWLGVLAGVPADARESNGTPEAKAQFALAETEYRAARYQEAAALFRKAIDLDRDFVEAHRRFIEATRIAGRTNPDAANGRLQQLYEGWAASAPRAAVYRWALGFLMTDPAKADASFRAALELDPQFSRAHFSLAKTADLAGDWVRQREHLAAAVAGNPDDPQYRLRYALTFKTSEPGRFRELAMAVVDGFGTAQTAVEALYHLASASSGEQRRGYLERARAGYPADRFNYTDLAMDLLYADTADPAAALSVARDMVGWQPKSKTWLRRVAFQESLVRAQALLAQQKFAEALAVLDQTERPPSHASTLVLLKAEAAAGAGQPAKAYDALVQRVAAQPDSRVETALSKQGEALGKDAAAIDADVWRLRDANATVAAPFTLTSYGGKPVTLAEYRGRVVLLAFWFPG